jgi:D-glycero-D-manno-heptose 1,7-bisphosphate phosphatase
VLTLKRRAVFLDRDGTLNRALIHSSKPFPPRNVDEFEILGDVPEAVNLLKQHGFTPVVVTNQPDLARGKMDLSQIEEMNHLIRINLNIDHIYTCFHDDIDNCACRKPKSGLLEMAASELNLDISESILVGDRWRDISAGQTAGCKCFFIDYKYNEKQPEQPFTRVSSLLEVAKLVGSTRDIQR